MGLQTLRLESKEVSLVQYRAGWQEIAEMWKQRRSLYGPRRVTNSFNNHLPDSLLEFEDDRICNQAVRCLRTSLSPGAIVLDIGTGPGYFAQKIVPSVISVDGQYLGVDLCDTMIADTQAALHGIQCWPSDQVRLAVGHGVEAPLLFGLEPESVDIIVFGRVLYHLLTDVEVDLAIDVASFLLKKQGVVLVYGAELDFNPVMGVSSSVDEYEKSDYTVLRRWRSQNPGALDMQTRFAMRGLVGSGAHTCLPIFSDTPFAEIYTYRILQKKRTGILPPKLC